MFNLKVKCSSIITEKANEMSVCKDKVYFPDPKKTYDKNGKDSMLKYVEQFDKLNALVPGGTVVKGKRI